jgi:anti-anti-sigma factor
MDDDFQSRFSVALERHDHDAVVRPSGALDAETAPQLERALSAVQAPGRRVVLDLRDVTIGDPCGLRPIVLAIDRAERLPGELQIRAGDDTRRAFDEAGLVDQLARVLLEDDVL